MTRLLALAAIMLWQMGAEPAREAAAPEHMRFERAVTPPGGTSGQACAVLDGSVYAHAAKESLNDLRLYAARPGGARVEQAFALTESGTQRGEDDAAAVRNLGMRGGDVVFDLEMPRRPYTAVVLGLEAKDFVATAKVSGQGVEGKPVELGSFALFDLSGQRLGRSTTLPLQEANFAVLHVELHVSAAPGAVKGRLDAGMVKGATVPPSREAQTLYTEVASTAVVGQRGRETVASVPLAAHVPVERVSFALAPGFAGNFLRRVTVVAKSMGGQDGPASESVAGEISRVKLPGAGDAGGVGIDVETLSVDATLGENLRSGATVDVSVANGDDAPLPIRGVALEMRQRRVCFEAAAGVGYWLMYGDEALRAPVYDYSRLFVAQAQPVAAALGVETANAGFVGRQDSRPYSERHPELLWIGLLGAIAVLGSVALRGAKRQGSRR